MKTKRCIHWTMGKLYVLKWGSYWTMGSYNEKDTCNHGWKITCFCFNYNYKYNYNLKFSITIIQVQVIVIRARPIWLFQADTDIDNRYINLFATKLCHYFSTNLTLKASLIPTQRKTIASTNHTPVSFIKKTNKKYNDLAINSQE